MAGRPVRAATSERKRRSKPILISLIHKLRPAAAAAGALLLSVVSAAAQDATVVRGKYVFDAAGCLGCHTDSQQGHAPLSGGPALQTPFGTFFAPNITPDLRHGIGGWTEGQFLRALREGVSPDGRHYYPVFPYTAYSKATEQDIRDLWAYLRTVPPSDRPDRPHEVGFPFSVRLTLLPWKWLNFSAGPLSPDPTKDAAWNRGAYLVEALTHCGECHTPRNRLGGLDRDRWMAGARFGANRLAPNLTSHAKGLQSWSLADIADSLEFGTTPEGDYLGNEMGEVVANSTRHLTKADRDAIATYIKSLPPVEYPVPSRSKP